MFIRNIFFKDGFYIYFALFLLCEAQVHNLTNSNKNTLNIAKIDLPLHIQKCQYYEKNNMTVLTRANVPTIIPTYYNKSLCGYTAKPMIVGGEPAVEAEFPHMALLGYGSEDNIQWKCGGSLISENFVLTAAHCLYDSFSGYVEYIRLGVTNKTRHEDIQQLFKVKNRRRPPNHSQKVFYHDIALIELDKSARFTEYVRPACLYSGYDTPPEMIATGWGDTAYSGNSSDILLKVALAPFSFESCNNTYVSRFSTDFKTKRKIPNGLISNMQFCTTSYKNITGDTCQGDSGGPLQIFHPTAYCMFSIVGVTSFGKSCGNVRFPGIYTNVSTYMPWIENTVWGS